MKQRGRKKREWEWKKGEEIDSRRGNCWQRVVAHCRASPETWKRHYYYLSERVHRWLAPLLGYPFRWWAPSPPERSDAHQSDSSQVHCLDNRCWATQLFRWWRQRPQCRRRRLRDNSWKCRGKDLYSRTSTNKTTSWKQCCSFDSSIISQWPKEVFDWL